MRDRYNIQDSDAIANWKYWENKGVFKTGKKYHVSEDGAWIVDPKGNKIAKNITTRSRDRSIGLLWYGWYLQIERLQTLQQNLKKRLRRHFDEIIEPLLYQILNGKDEAVVWFIRTEDPKERLRNCTIRRETLTHRDFNLREQDDPVRKRGHYLSWSENSISDGINRLPKCQQPQPQALGTLLRKHMDYREDLQGRMWRVSSILNEAITCRLSQLGDTYPANSIIEFKINNLTYIFKRLETHRAWEQIGTKVNQVNLAELTPELPHDFDSFKYQRLWKKTK